MDSECYNNVMGEKLEGGSVKESKPKKLPPDFLEGDMWVNRWGTVTNSSAAGSEEKEPNLGRDLLNKRNAITNVEMGRVNNLQQSAYTQAMDMARLQGKAHDPETIQENFEDLVKATRDVLAERDRRQEKGG